MAHTDQSVVNLARKWRSKNFSQIVGQELPVRILQNSLFKDYFFPVYLFAGQRGCGKTSTARIFAGALNCFGLADFQKNPKLHSIPCLECASCSAMRLNNHPDFIEIDAASNTGVDNVRNIIEAASYLPVLGKKRIYLIDEAHMLSKAAFNAFLKILEEPPTTVVFMLATTDPHKIIETVRSRCFQLFFGPIEKALLVEHLCFICQQESIEYEQQALMTIAYETEGSARDALNLLEQVRFSAPVVSHEAVLQALGHLPEHYFLQSLEYIVMGNTAALLQLLQEHFSSCATLPLWQKLIAALKECLYSQQEIEYKSVFQDKENLKLLAGKVSQKWILQSLKHAYGYEELFLKSSLQKDLLETLFLELSLTQKDTSFSPLKAPVPSVSSGTSRTTPLQKEVSLQQKSTQFVNNKRQNVGQAAVAVAQEVAADLRSDAPLAACVPVLHAPVLPEWHNFLLEIENVQDNLLFSIFKQAMVKEYDATAARLELVLSKESAFFTQWIDQSKMVWEPLLHKSFGQQVVVTTSFDAALKAAPAAGAAPARRTVESRQPLKKEEIPKAQPQGVQKKVEYARFTPREKSSQPVALPFQVKPFIIKNKDEWPLASTLLEQVGGSLSEITQGITDVE